MTQHFIITEQGVPIFCRARNNFLTPADWTDEHGIRRHAGVEVDGRVYVTPETAAAMGATA